MALESGGTDALEEILGLPPRLPEPLDRTRPIVLYGAGGKGREVLRLLLREAGHDVAAFIDRSVSGLVDGNIYSVCGMFFGQKTRPQSCNGFRVHH